MINTVKIQGSGYLVNGNLLVPNDIANRHYSEVQDWIALGNTPDPEFNQAELNQQALVQAKQTKVNQVANITVTTTSGKTFDGDETAQGRMARAVSFSKPLDTTQWVLADNTVATVTREELVEAGLLAGQAMTAIWVA